MLSPIHFPKLLSLGFLFPFSEFYHRKLPSTLPNYTYTFPCLLAVKLKSERTHNSSQPTLTYISICIFNWFLSWAILFLFLFLLHGISCSCKCIFNFYSRLCNLKRKMEVIATSILHTPSTWLFLLLLLARLLKPHYCFYFLTAQSPFSALKFEVSPHICPLSLFSSHWGHQ